MVKLIVEFMRLFVMRVKPQDIPYSKVLVGLLVVIFVGINVPLNLIFSNLLVQHVDKAPLLFPLRPIQALLIVSSYLLVMWVSIYGGLAFYNLKNRFVQTITSVIGIEIFLSLWFALILIIPMSVLTGILFVMLLYWQFMLHIYIFSNSLSCSLLKAGLFALLYILLQHNISEILLNTFMRRV